MGWKRRSPCERRTRRHSYGGRRPLRGGPGVGDAGPCGPAGAGRFTRNPGGKWVGQGLDGDGDGDGDAATLAQRLLPEFEGVTAEQLERDIEAFLNELLDLGLVSDHAPV